MYGLFWFLIVLFILLIVLLIVVERLLATRNSRQPRHMVGVDTTSIPTTELAEPSARPKEPALIVLVPESDWDAFDYVEPRRPYTGPLEKVSAGS